MQARALTLAYCQLFCSRLRPAHKHATQCHTADIFEEERELARQREELAEQARAEQVPPLSATPTPSSFAPLPL